MRLLWQGYELYTTGMLPIRVPDPAPYFEFGRQIVGDPEAKAARTLIIQYELKFDAARTVLPDQPDERPLEDFLQRVRKANMER